jgi:hypothetical protein
VVLNHGIFVLPFFFGSFIIPTDMGPARARVMGLMGGNPRWISPSLLQSGLFVQIRAIAVPLRDFLE